MDEEELGWRMEAGYCADEESMDEETAAAAVEQEACREGG